MRRNRPRPTIRFYPAVTCLRYPAGMSSPSSPSSPKPPSAVEVAEAHVEVVVPFTGEATMTIGAPPVPTETKAVVTSIGTPTAEPAEAPVPVWAFREVLDHCWDAAGEVEGSADYRTAIASALISTIDEGLCGEA